MPLDPALAAVRLAVRRCLTTPAPPTSVGEADGLRTPAPPILVGCSGGADSLALLAATVFEGRKLDLHVVGVTVDHGLQEGSAERADHVVQQMAALGAAETGTIRVHVEARGLGVEAAAREARYAALEELAARFGASGGSDGSAGRGPGGSDGSTGHGPGGSDGSAVVLLGHTLDDQAETVLLGLTRGSGGRSIAGMRTGFGPFRRPLLGITRKQTEQACAAEGIDFWRDPHNEDPRFTRARIRHRVMPTLEEELGPGVAATLARTAAQLQEDLATLDRLAEEAHRQVRTETGLRLAGLQDLDDAIRRRVIREAAVAAGATPSELFRVHVLAVDELVGEYRGQRHLELPGHVQAFREDHELRFRRTAGRPDHGPVAG